jgi:hypothetical protein
VAPVPVVEAYYSQTFRVVVVSSTHQLFTFHSPANEKMQLKNLFSIGLLASAVFAQGPKTTAETAIGDITAGLETLNKEIKSWTGDVVGASQVLVKAQDLLDVIKKSTAKIGSEPVMALNDAVKIVKPANELVKVIKPVIDGLTARKQSLADVQLTSVARDLLNNFSVEAKNLVGAIRTKIPDNVKVVADSIAKQIDAEIQKGIVAFA